MVATTASFEARISQYDKDRLNRTERRIQSTVSASRMAASASLPELPLSKKAATMLAYNDPVRMPNQGKMQRVIESELRDLREEEAETDRRRADAAMREVRLQKEREKQHDKELALEGRLELEKQKAKSRAELEEMVIALGDQVKSLVFQSAGIAERTREEAFKEVRHKLDEADAREKSTAALARKERKQLKAELKLEKEERKAAEQLQKRTLEAAARAEERHTDRVGTLAANRISQLGVTRAWTVWCERRGAAKRHRRMLGAAANRLLRPKLLASLSAWRRDWQEAASEEGQQRMRLELQQELEAMKEQHRALKDAAARELSAKDRDHSREAAVQQELQKQQRIEQLHQQAARRFGKAEYLRGWTAWLDLYQEQQRHKRMLAAAAARLMRPKLAASLTHWRADWQLEQRAVLEAGQRMLAEQRETQSEENAALRAEMAAAQKAFAKERRALEDKLAAQTSSAEELMHKKLLDQLEEQKEKRVAHLQQMAARRFGKAEYLRGWTAWLDLYQEQQRHKRMLAAAAARLLRPKLAASITHWRVDWDAARQATIKAAYETRARLAEETKAKAVEEASKVAEDRAKALAQKAEAVREKRIAHVQEMAAHRLGKRELSRGWTAWQDLYLEHARHKRMLASAAARLIRPKLAASLTHWRVDWQYEQRAALEEGQRLLRHEQNDIRAQHKKELARLSAEHAAALAAKEEEKHALAERLGGEVLTAQQEAALDLAVQLEEARGKRIEHIKEMAVRRLGKQELSRGWTAWQHLYFEQARHKRMLASAAGRLSRPKLAASLTHWRVDWQVTQRALLEEGKRVLQRENERNSASHEKALQALRAEHAAVLEAKEAELRDALEKADGEVLTKEQEHAMAMAQQLEEQREKRIEHIKEMAVRRLGKQELSRGW